MKKILIVEDDAIAAASLEMQLKRWGYEQSKSVRSGAAALSWAKSELPDVILMDVNLAEEKDGVEIALEIYAQRPVAIIFITGYPRRDIEARYDAGLPFKYLSKPVNRDELKRLLELPPV